MKVSKELPPNYADIVRAIPEIAEHKPIFCFGDTVYNVEGELRKDLDIHEEIHSKQQGVYPGIWWYQYLTDKEFRLKQEIEAYGAQYAFISKALKGRWLRYGLDKMAHDLSSGMYGNLLCHNEAVSKIRNQAKDYDRS